MVLDMLKLKEEKNIEQLKLKCEEEQQTHMIARIIERQPDLIVVGKSRYSRLREKLGGYEYYDLHLI